MIALPTYSGETAIFGLGRSGLAAVAALCAAGNLVVAWDDAEAPRAKAAELGADIRDLAQDFGSAERLIVSPGVPLTHPEPHGVIAAARAANAEIWGDMDLFADALAHAPVWSLTLQQSPYLTYGPLHLTLNSAIDLTLAFP